MLRAAEVDTYGALHLQLLDVFLQQGKVGILAVKEDKKQDQRGDMDHEMV